MSKTVIREITPQEVLSMAEGGQTCQIVDVREPAEYETERIAGSTSLPLSSLKEQARTLDRTRPIYIVCRTGNRARRASALLAELGITDAFVMQGGLQSWIGAGLPVERTGRSVWSMDRQVRFTAGLLVLVGIALAYTVNANWICLSAFVALGMIISAVTDSCGMAVVLGRMPWNRASCGNGSRG
ncbi:MAG TPA: rhodanese-like domain-containing protein [Candidatus Obscuribacterales bacterium]